MKRAKQKRTGRHFVRVSFPDGRNVDVLLDDLQRSLDATDRVIAAMPGEFALSEAARQRIARRLETATDAEVSAIVRDQKLEKARENKIKRLADGKNDALGKAAEMKQKNPALSRNAIARKLCHELDVPEGTLRGWLGGR